MVYHFETFQIDEDIEKFGLITIIIFGLITTCEKNKAFNSKDKEVRPHFGKLKRHLPYFFIYYLLDRRCLSRLLIPMIIGSTCTPRAILITVIN